MEYSVHQISKISGVSARTLRYYDEIGLLKPSRVASTGYRFYGRDEVDQLQQILLYRELDFSLEDIKCLLSSSDYDREKTFHAHLEALRQRQERLNTLIRNVKKSIASMKGEIQMSEQEKFEGLKQSLIDENEKAYGAEIRKKYGEEAVNESNARVQGLTKEQYGEGERILALFEKTLKAAFDTGDPACELAQEACGLHRQWLAVFYPKYSKEYHRGLAEMYVADDRFRANYDKLAPGCTEFLRDAIIIYCNK